MIPLSAGVSTFFESYWCYFTSLNMHYKDELILKIHATHRRTNTSFSFGRDSRKQIKGDINVVGL